MMFKSIVLGLAACFATLATMPTTAAAVPRIDAGFQEEASVNCTISACDITFPPTTAPVTEITNISCIANGLPAGTQISYTRIYDPFGGTFSALQSYVFGADTDGSFSVGFNGTTKLFFPVQVTPIFSFRFYSPATFNNGGIGLDCTISGFTHT